MAKNNNLTDFATDLADAIRAKCGTTGTINPQDFSKFVGGMPFYKKTRTQDLTDEAASPIALVLNSETGYQKARVYLTNDNGATELPNGDAFVALNEGGSTNIINALHSTSEEITISGFPYISSSVYLFYFNDDTSGGANLISAGWHIKADIFDLYMGNPDGENTKIDLNNATGGGV